LSKDASERLHSNAETAPAVKIAAIHAVAPSRLFIFSSQKTAVLSSQTKPPSIYQPHERSYELWTVNNGNTNANFFIFLVVELIKLLKRNINIQTCVEGKVTKIVSPTLF
jgi:hypothetical protein